MKYLLSCSFGKDSIASMVTYLKHGGVIDEAIYCKIMFDDNISAELPEHEKWIHNIAIPKIEREYSIKTKIIQADKTYKDYFYSKFQRGKYKGEIYGFPLNKGNWCTSLLKTNVLTKYKNSFDNYKEIIGITYDEPNRMKTKRSSSNVILPLVDYKITQEESFKIAKDAGLLSPVYNKNNKRLGCWFCHKQKINELRKLRKHYPELWNELLVLDTDSRITFTKKFRQKAHNFSRGMNGVFFQGTHYTVDICMVYML